MSYDLEICVKIEGCDQYARIAEPKLCNPTYNLGKMFRACMGWDYSQSELYPCSFAIEKVEHGIKELSANRDAYMQYNPSNGWGSLDGALAALASLRNCIYEVAEEIPLSCLYMRW